MKTCRKNLHPWVEGIKTCAECKRLYLKRPDVLARRAANQRARTYGLKPNDIELMLSAQNYRCANNECNATKPGGKGTWYVDHCHTSGKVRGVLCHHCNIALGNAKDCPQRLIGLANYVEAFKMRESLYIAGRVSLSPHQYGRQLHMVSDSKDEMTRLALEGAFKEIW
jgi:Recombination endonuclease VII